MIRIHVAAGGAVSFGTFTSGEHHADDSLERSLGILRKAWQDLIHCRAWFRLRERHGIMGVVLAYEFTHGSEGWHPHLHALWFHRAPLDAGGLVDVDGYMHERWDRSITAAGRYLNPRHGIDLVFNAQAPELGGYIAKVQEGDWGVAQEMVRGDAKVGRRNGGRTPFSILRDYYLSVGYLAVWRDEQTGDLLRAGDHADWQLWQEFCDAVVLSGNRSIPLARMTPGLRRAVLGADPDPPKMSDEELALVEVGGALVAKIAWRVWVRIRQAGKGPEILDAAVRGGLEAINEVLAKHGLGWADPPRED